MVGIHTIGILINRENVFNSINAASANVTNLEMIKRNFMIKAKWNVALNGAESNLLPGVIIAKDEIIFRARLLQNTLGIVVRKYFKKLPNLIFSVNVFGILSNEVSKLKDIIFRAGKFIIEL